MRKVSDSNSNLNQENHNSVRDNGSVSSSRKDSKTTSGLIPKIIATVLLLISIIGLAVLNFSGTKSNDNEVNVVFVDFDRDTVIPNSFAQALNRAGFNTDATLWDSDDDIIKEYGDEELILVIAGDKALELVTKYEEFDSVLGFVLIDPVYPGNMAMSEFGTSFPRQSLAIFMPYDDSTTLADMPDGKLIYERLSGDDTLFGNSIKHNSRFSSTVFISSNQKNYLSISAFEFADDATLMLLNPVFQNEFVQYLGTTYYRFVSEDYKASMVFTRYVLVVAFIFIGLCGLLLYMYAATKKTDDVERKRFALSEVDGKNATTVYKVVGIAICALFIIFIPVSYFLIKDYKFMCCALSVFPILGALYQYLITKSSGRLIRANSIAVKDAKLVEVIAAFFVQPLLLFLVLFALAGNNLGKLTSFDIIFTVVLLLLNFCVSALRSVFAFKSITKNIPSVILSVLVFIFGLIVVDLNLMLISAILLMLTLVPDFFEGNIRRFTRKAFLYSLIQTITYAIIVLFLV